MIKHISFWLRSLANHGTLIRWPTLLTSCSSPRFCWTPSHVWCFSFWWLQQLFLTITSLWRCSYWSSHGLCFFHSKAINSIFVRRRGCLNQILRIRCFSGWRLFFSYVLATLSIFTLSISLRLFPTLSSMSFIAPEVCDIDLRIGVHFHLHSFEKFKILIKFHVNNFLLVYP